jgi:hypothetical protein
MNKKQTPAEVATTIANYIRKQEEVLSKYPSGPMANTARKNLEKAQRAMDALIQANEGMRMQQEQAMAPQMDPMMAAQMAQQMQAQAMPVGNPPMMRKGGKVENLLSGLSQMSATQPASMYPMQMAAMYQNMPSQNQLLDFALARYNQRQLNSINPSTIGTNPYVLQDYNNAMQYGMMPLQYNPPAPTPMAGYMYGGYTPDQSGKKKKFAPGGPINDATLGLDLEAPTSNPVLTSYADPKNAKERKENAARMYMALVAAGHPFPEVGLSQYIQENGWKIKGDYDDYFGIKYNERDAARFTELGIPFQRVYSKTDEEENGQLQQTTDDFFFFPSPEVGARAYTNFLQNNSNYASALQNAKTPQEFITGIAGSYATGSRYADSVLNVMTKSFDINPTAARGTANVGNLGKYLPSNYTAGQPSAGATYGQSSANASNQATAPILPQSGTGRPETQANAQAVASGLTQFAPILSFRGQAITGPIQKKGNYVYAPNAQGGYNVVDVGFYNKNSSKSLEQQFQELPASVNKAFAVPAAEAQSWVSNPKPTDFTYNHKRDHLTTTREAVGVVLTNPLGGTGIDVGNTPTYIDQTVATAGFRNTGEALVSLFTNPVATWGRLTAASNQVVQAPGTIQTSKGKGTQGFTAYDEFLARETGKTPSASTTPEGSRLRSESLIYNMLGLPVPVTGAGAAGAAAVSARPSTALALTQGPASTALARSTQAVQTAPNWINYADDAAGRAGVLNLGFGPLNPAYAAQVANASLAGQRAMAGVAAVTNQYTPRLVPSVEVNQATSPVIPGLEEDAYIYQSGTDTGEGALQVPVPPGFTVYNPPAITPGTPKPSPQLNIEEVQGDTINVPKVSWLQAIPALASMASARIARNALADLQAPQAPRTTMVPQFEYESNIGQALQDVRNATIAQSRNTMLSSGQAAALRQGMLAERFNQEARLRSADQQQRQQAQQSYQALATNVRIANDNLRNEYIKDSVAFANERKMMDANLRIAPLNTLSASVSDYLKNIYQPGLANALYAANRPYETEYTTETTAE